ncbi:MAG: hypothetical protein CVU61_11725 [Deltaproteobacteria bacterium HGW-Deltaproteobacteria-19]|nr:MAG: hypothetical protein CVU61_11725 [Deltaproteobacteria bacterium HGW-Deltaproteobacteria-19]
MKVFVFITGMMNVLGGILFAMPGALLLAGIEAPANRFWLLLPALFLFFLGIILIYSSRDLAHRATIVFWDGFSRVTAFAVFVWYGLCAGMGAMLAVLGVVDLAIALVFFIGLPRVLHRDFLSILFDHRDTAI